MLATSYMRDERVRSTPYTRVQERSANVPGVRRSAWVDLGREERVPCISVDIQESVHRESHELEHRYTCSLCFFRISDHSGVSAGVRGHFLASALGYEVPRFCSYSYVPGTSI